MANIITENDDDDLTPTQEYAIAGVVILLFGLLYWFLNHGWGSTDADNVTAGSPLPDSSLVMVKPASLPNSTALQADMASAGDARVPPAGVQTSAAVEVTAASTQVSAPATGQTVAAVKPEAATAVATTETALASDEPAPPAKAAVSTDQDTGPVGIASPATTAKPAVQAPAVAVSTQKTPAQVYKLPDGSEVTLGSTGFETGLLQSIMSGEVNKPVIFDKIMFDKGSTSINASSEPQIKATAALLNSYPAIKLLIRGHTDETGVSNSNTELSLLRANEVGVALVNLGIDRTRLRIMGMGDSAPIDTNTTEEGRKNNRRVDAMIIQ